MGQGQRTAAGAFGILLVAGAVVLVALTDSEMVDVLSLVFGALGVFVAIWQVWQSGQVGTAPDPLATQLARRVRGQCESDALANDLNAQQLRVRWQQAAPELADRTGRAIESELLTGDWLEVSAQYSRITTGRWVVLGEGGAGKSALMLHLMRELLTESGESIARVPVLVPLSAWNPTDQVQAFLADYLTAQFPGLRLPGGLTPVERRQALEELVRDRVLPIFDGLDEMDPGQRVEALRGLSEQDRRFPFVLTSRPDAYRSAIAGRGAGLAHAAVVELVPLELAQITEYLRDAPGGAEDEWPELLGESDPLAQALSTPLMVWLAAAAYAHQPGALVQGIDLTSPTATQEITDRLLDALIPARLGKDSRWRLADVERWLTYLAAEVEHRKSRSGPGSEADDKAGRIAWWRLADSAEPVVSRIAAAAALLTTGGAVGLGVGLLFGPWIGAASGLVLGVLIGRGATQSRLEPTTVEFRLGLRLPVGLAAGLFIGLIAGGAVFVLNRDLSAVWALAGFGVPLGIVYGLTSPVDVEHAISPATVLKRERAFVLAYVLAYGLACGISGTVAAGPVYGAALGIAAGLAGGLFNGLPWLVVHRLSRSKKVDPRAGAVAWFRFLLAKLTWLRRPSVLPWRLMTFLDHARERGVLQQVGATYTFRHSRLSKRLALRTTAGTTAAVSPDHGSPDSAAVAGN